MNNNANKFCKLISIIYILCVISLPGNAYAGNQDMETVTLQLKWTHQFQFAGYYAAIEQGFYKDEGLNVILKEGTPATHIVNEIISGNADFGVDNTSLLVERDHGNPVVVLAAIFQHSPQVLVTRKESGIVSPHDLKYKKIMLVKEQSTDILAMLLNEGVDIDKITIVPHTWDLDDLISGKVDAMTVYSIDEPFMLQEKNVEFNIINPINYGIDYYGDCLFTSENQIAANPERVKRFVRASLKGWEYAMSHQNEMIDLILTKYNTNLSTEKLQFEAAGLNKVIVPDYVELGHINPGRWAKIIETHQKFGLINSNFSLDGFLYNPDNASRLYNKLVGPLFILTGILSLGLILFIIFNAKLKAVVKERTESLEKKIKQLKDREETIQHLAHHDFLTDLPNRLLLKDRIELARADAYQNNGRFAVVFLDLDDFKRINDAIGHSAGDEFLQVVACRLKDCLQAEDTVARIGGDEFVLILADTGSFNCLLAVVEEAINAIRAPWDFKGTDFHISTSVGIAIYPKDGQEADTLIKAADMAMYEAKQKGKNRYHFFTEEMHLLSINKLILETELRHAINSSQLILHYQPQVKCSGRITGVEALVRWNHPTKGLLYPDCFIDLAEETGLIIPLGDWVLRSACMQSIEWQKAGLPPVLMSVNLSAKQFQHPDLLTKIGDILSETGLSPALLQLEVTETVAMIQTELTFSMMNSLRAMGIKLVLDDFGIGYSSLTYLKSFPIDNLKIDKSFTQDITTDLETQAIIQAILELAKRLHIGIVAEGVETVEQYNCLKELACPLMQGYLFSRPVPAPEIAVFLQNNHVPYPL